MNYYVGAASARGSDNISEQQRFLWDHRAFIVNLILLIKVI